MDSPRRRIAALCSHLRPLTSVDSPPHRAASDLSASICSSDSRHENNNNRVRDSNSAVDDDECVFCRIVCGKSPAYKLYEDDMCMCILDTRPLCRGHSLLIPKLHFPSLETTPASVIAAMFSKIPFISNAIVKATGCDSFNLVVNNGAAAGQVIFHTHIHLIPRKANDCLWATESMKRLSLQLDNEASQLAERIRAQMLFSSGNVDEMRIQGPCSAGNYRE